MMSKIKAQHDYVMGDVKDQSARNDVMGDVMMMSLTNLSKTHFQICETFILFVKVLCERDHANTQGTGH